MGSSNAVSQNSPPPQIAYLKNLQQLLIAGVSIKVGQTIFDLDKNSLFRQGEQLNEAALETLMNSELARPIEESIQIESALTAETLEQTFSHWLESDANLKAAEETLSGCKNLKPLCQALMQFAPIRQHLSLMQRLYPALFDQALFCAWLGVIVMQENSRSSNDIRDIFFASMCHDLGQLFLPPELLQKQGDYSIAERCLMQEHCVLGQQALKRINRFPEEVVRAVWEHHENLDGTGYPLGRLSAMIGRHGQMLNALDCLHAIYVKRYRPAGRSLGDLVGAIKMNGHGRFGVLGKKLIELLSSLSSADYEGMAEVDVLAFIDHISLKDSYIQYCVEALNELNGEIGFRHSNSLLFALQNAIIHISVATSQSGLINEGYMRWLAQVKEEKLNHAYKEVEDAYLLMLEVEYHIEKLKQKLEYLASLEELGEQAPTLLQGVSRLNESAAPQLPERFDAQWLAEAQ